MAIENDIVLIHLEDQPMAFARVESILPDHKPNWYHIKLLLLQVPLQVITWILRDVYIDGGEFTMDGKRMRLEKVISPEDSQKTAAQETEDIAETKKEGRVISLADMKKKK